MLNAAEIRNVKFSKARGGYKQEEVDVLLDRIEADYAQFERASREYKMQIDALNKEIDNYKASQNSIQNVLVSAQQLADKIVDDAKQKSKEIVDNAEASISVITAREKELAAAFELKAQERKTKLEAELDRMVKSAKIKSDSMLAAAQDSVARQQLLYDKIKMEMSAFKAAVSAKYREHLELIKSLPDTAPADPKNMAELVSAAVDKMPSPESFITANTLTDMASNAEVNAVSEPIAAEPEKEEHGFSISDSGDFSDAE